MTTGQLEEFGLNTNQAKAYLALLNAVSMTPPDVAREIGVTRTNAYELMDQLVRLELITRETSGPKTVYRAKSPTVLRQLLQKRQQELRQRQELLDGLMPSLFSTYRLTQDQPGLLYLEGKSGLSALFDDILRAGTEVLILPSDFDRDDPDISKHIDEQIKRQVAAKIPVRAIYPDSQMLGRTDMEAMKKNLVQIHYAPFSPLPAQMMVYGGNVAFSTYRHGVVTTVITNTDIAESMRLVFESMWRQATEVEEEVTKQTADAPERSSPEQNGQNDPDQPPGG